MICLCPNQKKEKRECLSISREILLIQSVRFPRKSLLSVLRWLCTESTAKPVHVVATRCSAFATRQTKLIIVQPARPAASCLLIARFLVCCAVIGRALPKNSKTPNGIASFPVIRDHSKY